MKIAICHTQLYMLGGGERVALTIASEMAKRGHSIVLYGITNYNKSFYEEYYNIDLSTVKFRTSFGLLSLLAGFGHYQRFIIPYILSKAKDFDLIIDTSSNGFYSIQTSTKSICYVHYPLGKLPRSILMKLFTLPIRNYMGYSFHYYDKIICNSLFTKNEVKLLTSKDVTVISPPVDVYNGPLSLNKEKIICTAGRIAFEKNIELMITSFKKIYATNPEWKLVIAGSSGNMKYLQKLKNLCKGLPVEFYHNVSHKTLCKIYSQSKIYWHAKGFGVSKKALYEHFGITTVEAMSYGCIPVVINKGGQCEIVDHGKNGFRWDTPDEMIHYTRVIIANNGDQNEMIQINAIKKSKMYGEDLFREKIAVIAEQVMNK